MNYQMSVSFEQNDTQISHIKVTGRPYHQIQKLHFAMNNPVYSICLQFAIEFFFSKNDSFRNKAQIDFFFFFSFLVNPILFPSKSVRFLKKHFNVALVFF